MVDLISALEDLELTLRNMQEHLRGVSWPSESHARTANDLIIWLGMSWRTAQVLRLTLVHPEEAKPEVKEAIEEEESGKGDRLEVQGEEVHEEPPEEAVQEPEAERSEGA